MVLQRTTDVDGFHSRVDATPAAVAGSRAAFETWVRSTQASDAAVHELTVVFSELVANAVHASPTALQQVESSAWTENGNLVLRVANQVEPASRPVRGPDLADPLRTGGRGLLIVRAYTDSIRTEVAGDTIAVRCERHIGV